MGRGDKRSKKGKIFKGSYGKTRLRKKKLKKLRFNKAAQKVKGPVIVSEQKPEVKPKEIIEIKEEKIERITVEAKPVEIIEKPVISAPATKEKTVEKLKVKAEEKTLKAEEKPAPKKRGRPKKKKED